MNPLTLQKHAGPASASDFKPLELEEDRKLDFFQKQGKLDKEGVVCQLPTNFEARVFLLDEAARKCIKDNIYRPMMLEGRNNELFPGVKTNIGESTQNAIEYCELIKKRFKLSLKGGAAFHAIRSMVGPIFEAWFLGTTPSKDLLLLDFITYLESDPNDWDLMFDLKGGMDESTRQQLIIKSLIEPLSKKFEALKDRSNPFTLVIKLLQAQKKGKDLPYLIDIFKRYPQVNSNMKDLYPLCIETFAFSQAVNIINDRSIFSLRSFGGFDCVFPEKVGILPTPKEAIYLNITPLVDRTEDSIVLESLLGNSYEDILQGLSDCNLKLTTPNSKIPPHFTDFARTISNMTRGGRWLKKGWLKTIVAELKKGGIDQGGTLSDFIARQLKDRVRNHHKNEPGFLIALLFNASVVLDLVDPQLEEEILNAWKLINSFVDIIQDANSFALSSSDINKIRMHMDDPKFRFKDLYYIYFQILSNIDQHCTKAPTSFPTETEGVLFTQWKITFNMKNNQASPACALLFPFRLKESLEYINSLETVPEPIPSMFQIVLSDPSLCFRFGGSRLQKYTDDPRKEYDSCLALSLLLLKKTKKEFWTLGFLSSLALLAQRHDPTFFKYIFNSFLAMIKGSWASVELKNGSIALFGRSLTASGIGIDPQLFYAIANNEKIISSGLLGAMMKTGDPYFHLCVNEYLIDFEANSNKLDYPSLTRIYTNLIEVSTDTRVLAIDPQWPCKLIERISRQAVFLPATKFNWFMKIYTDLPQEVLDKNVELEERLFEEILLLTEQFCEPPKELPKEISRADTSVLVQQLVSSKNRKKAGFKTERLMKAFDLLKLWRGKDKITVELNIAQSIDIAMHPALFQNKEMLLKAMLEKFLKIINPNSNEIDELLFILNFCVKSQIDFTLIDAALNTIGEIYLPQFSSSQLTELSGILVRVQKNLSFTHPKRIFELLIDYFKKMKDESHRRQVGNTLCLLLADFKEVNLQNNAYREFVCLFQIKSYSSCMKGSQHIVKLFQRLYERKMVDEILELYHLLERSSVIQTCEEYKIVISTLQKTRENGRYRFSIEQIEELLTNLPVVIRHEPELLSDLADIYQFLFLHYSQRDELLKAYEWLNKELSVYRRLNPPIRDEAMKRTFGLLFQLIKAGHYQEVFNTLLFLDTRGFADQWLMILQQLLLHHQAKLSISILEKKMLQNVYKFSSHSQTWTTIIEMILAQSHEIAKWKDKSHRELLTSMLTIVHQFFAECPPTSKELWKLYLHALTLHGPLAKVEERGEDFVKNGLQIMDNESERKVYGKWFFMRLCQEGSMILLNKEVCWLPFMENLKPGDLQFQILFKSAIKACKTKDKIPYLNDKLQDIYNLFDHKKMDFIQNYYIGRLLYHSTDEKLLLEGIKNVTTTLTNGETDPLYYKKAVILTSLYLKKILGRYPQFPEQELAEAIKAALNSDYSNHSDYFSLLRTMYRMGSPITKCYNNKRKIFSNVYKATTTDYYRVIVRVLKLIINDPESLSHKTKEDSTTMGAFLRDIVKGPIGDGDAILFLKENPKKIEQFLTKVDYDDIYRMLSQKFSKVGGTTEKLLSWRTRNENLEFEAKRKAETLLENTWDFRRLKKIYLSKDEQNAIYINYTIKFIQGITICLTVYLMVFCVSDSIAHPKKS